ncbi:hypothetical protein, partial [Roseibium sp. RKSG952]|uniref:hypothetical protein n=1 Tax=Roseibium sp. RKSG952 TaxID=2529384 RepID=UPI001AD93F86
MSDLERAHAFIAEEFHEKHGIHSSADGKQIAPFVGVDLLSKFSPLDIHARTLAFRRTCRLSQYKFELAVRILQAALVSALASLPAGFAVKER